MIKGFGGIAVIAFSFKSYFLLTGAILLIPFMVINARSKNEISSHVITVMVIKDLGLSPGIAAALISLKGASTLLVAFLGGAYLQKNNNKLYIFAYVTTILSLLLLGIGTDTIQLGLASVINGVGTGLVTLVNFTEVGSIDGEKGKIAGFFSFGNGAGAIIGPMLGGIIGDVYGVKAIFLAFIPLFCALSLFTFMIDRKQN